LFEKSALKLPLYLLSKTLQKLKKGCKFALASPTQLAPLESPRAGTQQGYTVVAV